MDEDARDGFTGDECLRYSANNLKRSDATVGEDFFGKVELFEIWLLAEDESSIG